MFSGIEGDKYEGSRHGTLSQDLLQDSIDEKQEKPPAINFFRAILLPGVAAVSRSVSP